MTITAKLAFTGFVVGLMAAACTNMGSDQTTTTPEVESVVTTTEPSSALQTSATTPPFPPAVPIDLEAAEEMNAVDPVLSFTMDTEVRIPNSTPSYGGEPLLHASELVIEPLIGATSATGNEITSIHGPLQDLELDLAHLLAEAQEAGQDPLADLTAAQDALDILTGDTHGRMYDGFALLNYNRGTWAEGQMAGEYKMKPVTDTGERFVSVIDGEEHTVWEIDVQMVWYGQNFDSDTFLIRIPFEAHPFDEFRVNWRIYSLIQEDLAPTTIMNDGFGRIFQGLDSTFASVPAESVADLTVRYPSLKHFRGMYVWGWGAHPPRVQFLQPVVEINEAGDLHPTGESFAYRTRTDLLLENIAPEAPEMKIRTVASAAIGGATGDEILAMLTDPDSGPAGTFREWLNLASDLRVLPPEAWDVLESDDGLARGDFGDYDIVLAYMNNEIYGESPYSQIGSEGIGGVVKDWDQGETMKVKVINFDRQVHYYRNVDFGAPLIEENVDAFGNGEFSFERFSPKPSYGVPKVAEMQWRTGWGYVPHMGVLQQDGLFPRDIDQEHLTPFLGQLGDIWYGYVYNGASDYWRFDPPEPIREGEKIDAGDSLREMDGSDGVLIGTDTEGFGVAQMPEGVITTHRDQEKFAEVTFPGFLRNPADGGGDIIPPTPVWEQFLAMNPETGTLFDADGAYWVDQTYLHGRPVPGGESIIATVEGPRASGQLFYQFDPLFHDNMIFSYHPRSDAQG
jgi:hypothetical protein